MPARFRSRARRRYIHLSLPSSPTRYIPRYTRIMSGVYCDLNRGIYQPQTQIRSGGGWHCGSRGDKEGKQERKGKGRHAAQDLNCGIYQPQTQIRSGGGWRCGSRGGKEGKQERKGKGRHSKSRAWVCGQVQSEVHAAPAGKEKLP